MSPDPNRKLNIPPLPPTSLPFLAGIEVLDGLAQREQVGADAGIGAHRAHRPSEEAVRLARRLADLLLPHRRDRIDALAEFGRVDVLRDEIGR